VRKEKCHGSPDLGVVEEQGKSNKPDAIGGQTAESKGNLVAKRDHELRIRRVGATSSPRFGGGGDMNVGFTDPGRGKSRQLGSVGVEKGTKK